MNPMNATDWAVSETQESHTVYSVSCNFKLDLHHFKFCTSPEYSIANNSIRVSFRLGQVSDFDKEKWSGNRIVSLNTCVNCERDNTELSVSGKCTMKGAVRTGCWTCVLPLGYASDLFDLPSAKDLLRTMLALPLEVRFVDFNISVSVKRLTFTMTALDKVIIKHPVHPRQNPDIKLQISEIEESEEEEPSMETVSVHRNVLTFNSPVFAREFESDMSESNTSIVKITDLPVEAVKKMVDFFYDRESFPNVNDWRVYNDLLKAAHRYQVDDLVQVCQTKLGLLLDEANVCCIAQLGYVYEINDLSEACAEFIAKDLKQLNRLKGWKEMKKKKPTIGMDLLERAASYVIT